jgi:phosphoglycolate phosphatase
MPGPAPLRLAIFDCDGTLVDSQHMIAACMRAAFDAEGLPPPGIAEVRRVVGLPLADCMRVLAPGYGPDGHSRLAEAFREEFHRPERIAGAAAEPLFPGCRTALDALEAAGWLLGIATAKGRRGLDGVLERHGLVGRFVTLQTGDASPGKPHPAVLGRALAEAGARATDAVMIGDTSFDMTMARRAGVRAIGVGWGYHDAADLRDAGAEAVAADYSELLRSLAGEPAR